MSSKNSQMTDQELKLSMENISKGRLIEMLIEKIHIVRNNWKYQEELENKISHFSKVNSRSNIDDCGNCFHKFSCKFSTVLGYNTVNQEIRTAKCQHYKCCYVS